MLVYYVTAHGYGHASRSCDILRAMRARHPDMPVTIVCGLPAAFFEARLGTGVPVRNAVLDVGMVQLDSVRTDVPASLTKVQALYARREELIQGEERFLEEVAARAVAVDIPALPVAAAARAGVPAVGIGNFAWDWIYEEYVDWDSGWRPMVSALREDYARAELALRLPFSEPMAAFPRRRDIPLAAAPGRVRREELAARTGADPKRRWILLSFTTLDWDRAAVERVARDDRYAFFTVLPLAWDHPAMHAVDRTEVPFSDVLASVDAVVSKPGFGIVSECIVNRKPLLYVDRAHFREYPYLVDGIRRFLQHAHIPAAMFYQGDVGPQLDRLFTADPPRETLASDQGAAAADVLWTYWNSR